MSFVAFGNERAMAELQCSWIASVVAADTTRPECTPYYSLSLLPSIIIIMASAAGTILMQCGRCQTRMYV